MTLLLSRSDLERLLDVGDCLAGLRQGFLAEPSPIAAQRVQTDLPGPGTAAALIPGLIEGIPAYTVKVNAKFPGSRPALRGVVCLHDARDGELLALLDSALLAAGRVHVDDVPLALSMGAPGTAGLSAAGIAGTLSQVLGGTVPGRTTDADVTVYTPVGLPWQDLALAWTAYQQACAANAGREVDLLA